MHASTTELSHTTLVHAKNLIKELDHAQFPYDRKTLLALLASFTHAHKQTDESATVEHLEKTLTYLEEIEHTYHDRIYAKEHQVSLQDSRVLLGSFQTNTLASPTGGGVFSGFFPRIRSLLAWLEVSLLWIVLLVGGSMLLLGGPHHIWYALIVLTFIGCAVLFLKRMYTWGGRLVVATLVGVVVVAWAMII